MSYAHKFPDNVDTDVICPGKYLSLVNPEDLAKVCLEGYESGYAEKIHRGDVFVAGKNFGCGSSREHAPLAIKTAGAEYVIAESFARIFFRNAINIGLPVLESPEAVRGIDEGDDVEVDLSEGLIKNKTKGTNFFFIPFPEKIMQILNAGSLEKYYKNKKEVPRCQT